MAAVGLSPTLANAMLALLDSLGYNYVQFHTEQPGAGGTANIAGQSTRVLVDWGTPTGGSVMVTADLAINDVPATETWKYWSAWTAGSGGTFGLSGQVTASQVTAGDDVTIDSESVTVTFTLASS